MEISKKLKLLKRNLLIFNKYLRVFEDYFEGYENPYYIVNFGEDYCELIILKPDSKIVLVGKIREAVREFMWTLPGGRIRPGEQPIDAARREAEEETEQKINRSLIKPLGKFLHSPARIENCVYLFFAKLSSSKKISQQIDKEGAESKLKKKEFSVSKVLSLIKQGKITNSTTILGILLALRKGYLKE